MLTKVCEVSVKETKDFSVIYFLTESTVNIYDKNNCKQYGIRLEKKLPCGTIDGACQVSDITTSSVHIKSIIDRLYKNIVTPISLKDIVYDLID